MKFAKMLFASVAFLALSTLFASKASAQTTVDKELEWIGASAMPAIDFVLGTTNASQLTNTANWKSSFQAFGTKSCSGTPKICVIRVKYTYNTPPGDPAPTIAEVLTQVSNNYTANPTPPASYFPVVNGVYEFTFTKNGITITLQVITKA